MKNLALLNISDLKIAKNEPYEILEENIDRVYYLGYVYDPYTGKFWNPFFDAILYTSDILTNNTDEIEELHYKNIFYKGKLSIDVFTIQNIIKKKQSSLLAFLFKLGPIIGIMLMITSIFTYFLSSITLTLILSLISIISLNLYTFKWTFKNTKECTNDLPIFFRKMTFFLIILSYLNYLFILIYLVKGLGNFWQPIFTSSFIVVILGTYLIPGLVLKHLSQEYWLYTGNYSIKEYAEENDIPYKYNETT